MPDVIDREIIRFLRNDGRMTNRELGRAVGLSPNAAGARVARLRERGIITGIHAHVDHAKLGRPLEVLIDLWFEQRRDNSAFFELLATDDRVIGAIDLTGPVDYRIHARVATPQDLQDLLNQLRDRAFVRQSDSRIVLTHLPTLPEQI